MNKKAKKMQHREQRAEQPACPEKPNLAFRHV
jgi:hypothetical protein